jgi:chemotaxis signal transduction protein
MDAAQQERELFQAVRCGALAVAFPYRWATTIVEKFQLTPIPRAPAWLAGAVNIDGRVIAVVDLARYGAKGMRAVRSEDSVNSTQAKRLLIGGIHGEDDDARFGILFSGMPQQIGRSVQKLSVDLPRDANTATVTDGAIESPQGERFAVVNVERLYEQLSAELSTL